MKITKEKLCKFYIMIPAESNVNGLTPSIATIILLLHQIPFSTKQETPFKTKCPFCIYDIL